MRDTILGKMYPEGWLIHPEGRFLLLFQKDTGSLERMPKGYMDKWSVSPSGTPLSFIDRRAVPAAEAVSIWIQLTEDGWRRIDRQFREAA